MTRRAAGFIAGLIDSAPMPPSAEALAEHITKFFVDYPGAMITIIVAVDGLPIESVRTWSIIRLTWRFNQIWKATADAFGMDAIAAAVMSEIQPCRIVDNGIRH